MATKWCNNSNNGNNNGNNNDSNGHSGISQPVTNCVSERTGVNSYTDVAPDHTDATTLFPAIKDSGYCPSSRAQIVPLTNDQDVLNAAIDNLPASGSTAGHLGVAWAWYLISPKWAAIFPDNEPAEYQGNTKKVVILMSDGDFNQKYGGPNAYAQTEALCDNMKAEGIEIYTVGFKLPNRDARDIMDYCATVPIEAHRFLTESTSELQTTYRQIGFSLKDLALSK